MYVILVIGSTQQGKTPFIKDYCKDSNCLVFDVQNEYGDKVKYAGQTPYGLPTDTNTPRSRVINLEVENFIQIASGKRKTICVFEEATMFFQGMTNDRMRKLLFSRAFTENVYLLVFHSINSVPPRIMEASNYVVLFKTNDEDKTVERKYPRLLMPFRILQKDKKPNGKHIKIKML